MTDTEQIEDEPMAENVIQALAWVEARIGGISKRRSRGEGDDRGIQYAFRGIDAIASAAQPLLGRVGVVIVPESITIDRIMEFQINNRPWHDTFVTADWVIYGPGGPTDKITATTQGIGRDNSDKSYNKAATQAFKNLLLRILCIGDPLDDTDGENNEADAHGQEQGARRPVPPRPLDDDPIVRTFQRARALTGTPEGEAVKALAVGERKALSERAFRDDPGWMGKVVEVLDGIDARKAQDAAAEAADDPQQDLAGPAAPPEGVDEATGEIKLPERDPNYPIVVVEDSEKPKRKTAREIAAERDAAKELAEEAGRLGGDNG